MNNKVRGDEKMQSICVFSHICTKFEFLVSQGSVATCLRWSGYCHMGFIANFIRFPAVQIFWKSVKKWQSYRQSKGGNFFETQCSSTLEELWRKSWLPQATCASGHCPAERRRTRLRSDVWRNCCKSIKLRCTNLDFVIDKYQTCVMWLATRRLMSSKTER